jgi:four helix bundle protein
VAGANFRRLSVYVRACSLADVLRAEVISGDSFDRWTSGAQLVRAADSIGANIAEAYGRERAADQRRFLYVARGSPLEAEHWVGRASARGLLDGIRFDSELSELGRMLNGLIRSHRSAGLRTEN